MKEKLLENISKIAKNQPSDLEGVKLYFPYEFSKNDSLSTSYTNVYLAKPLSGFEKIECRFPIGNNPKNPILVALSIPDNSDFSENDILDYYGKINDLTPPHPNQSINPLSYSVYFIGDTRVSFGFPYGKKNGKLNSVIIKYSKENKG